MRVSSLYHEFYRLYCGVKLLRFVGVCPASRRLCKWNGTNNQKDCANSSVVLRVAVGRLWWGSIDLYSDLIEKSACDRSVRTCYGVVEDLTCLLGKCNLNLPVHH